MKILRNIKWLLIFFTFQLALTGKTAAQAVVSDLLSSSYQNLFITDTTDTYHLTIHPGWNWISFPRLDRDINDPVPSQPVLENITLFPSYLQMLGYPLQQNDPPQLDITYQNQNWSGQLNDIISTFGYKLETNNESISYLPMTGSILDPSTQISIYPDHDNWIGYFLPETQSPFEAIPEELLEHLLYIRGQYWFCFIREYWIPPQKSTTATHEWL